MSVLLIEREENALRAAVLMQGKLYAYADSTLSPALREGQIYLGVVDRALKGASAVFVRLPGKEFGFLPLSSGEKALSSGSRVIVQVKRPPDGAKKAFLSRDIALAGTGVVVLPTGAGVHISSRVTDAEEREALRTLGERLSPTQGGLIIRSAARNADPSELQAEIDRLHGLWAETQKKAQGAAAPVLLQDGDDPIRRLLREEQGRLEYVLTNDPESLPKNLSCPVRVSEHPFLLHNVQAKLERSLRRTVQMKSGATLVIDPCEAMTVIDVNSAMAAGGKSIQDTAERINAEAAQEVARLLRLRGIGGIVIIDFIDMPTQAARDRITDLMKTALLEDPEKTTVHGFTALGLMEMTRRREHTPLTPLPDVPCPHCGGTGLSLDPLEEDALDA